MNYTEAIMTIVRYGKEFQAIEELFGFVKRKNEKIEKENATMSSCLRAIKKLISKEIRVLMHCAIEKTKKGWREK